MREDERPGDREDREDDRERDSARGGPPPPHGLSADPGVAGDRALDAALAQLPRQLAAPAALEQRVVEDLHRRGLLNRGRGVRSRVGSRRMRAVPRWAPAAAAAGVALLLVGYAVGHQVGSAQTAKVLLATQKQSAEAAVRQSGAAYVAALAALADRRARSGDAAVAAAVESQARVAFVAAADQMMRLLPDDPLAAGILRALDRGAGAGAAAQSSDSTAAQHVVWF